MNKVALIIVIITGLALGYATLDMPGCASPDMAPHCHIVPRYLEKAIEETGTPNVVTAILADYRGYDTLGEETVIFTAGIAVILLLSKLRRND